MWTSVERKIQKFADTAQKWFSENCIFRKILIFHEFFQRRKIKNSMTNKSNLRKPTPDSRTSRRVIQFSPILKQILRRYSWERAKTKFSKIRQNSAIFDEKKNHLAANWRGALAALLAARCARAWAVWAIPCGNWCVPWPSLRTGYLWKRSY